MKKNKQMLFPPAKQSRGWTIVVVLVGVMLVLVLYMVYFKSQSTAMGPGSNAIDGALDDLEKSQDAAYGINPENKDATPTPRQYNSALGSQFRAIDQARSMQTLGNLKAINENLMMWKMTHPDMEVTMENLQKTNFSFPALKGNMEYYIVDDAVAVREKK